MRKTTGILLALALVSATFAEDDGEKRDDGETRPLVKLSPEVRTVERDRRYFEELDCIEADVTEARSEREEQWLQQRRSECLRRVRELAE